MSEEIGASRGPGADAGTRGRRLLSVLLILHWGAVAAYLLPATRAALDPLPDWLEPPVAWVAPRYVRWTSPVTVPYWNLTATRQTWTLFAPDPAGWVSSVRVVPYFRRGAAGEGWAADTVVLRGPEERTYPHFVHHRSYRILWNLGYEEWGAWYRPLFAREMCRTLRDEEGRGPEGVLLMDRWTSIPLPWDATPATTYDQRLGGFDCAPADAGALAAWPPYGIPERLDTRAWPRVQARADEPPEGAPAPTSAGSDRRGSTGAHAP